MEDQFVPGTPSDYNWNLNQFGGLPSASLPAMVFRGNGGENRDQFWEDYNSSSLISYVNVGEMHEDPPPFIPYDDCYVADNTDEGVDLSLGYQLFQREMGNFLCDEEDQEQQQNVNNSLGNPTVGSCCSMNGGNGMSNSTGSPYSGVEIPSHAYGDLPSAGLVDPAPKFQPITTTHFLELGLGFSGGSTDILSLQQLQQLRQALYDFDHSEKQSRGGTMSGGSVVDISRPSSTFVINLKSLLPSENSGSSNGNRGKPQLSRKKPYRRIRSGSSHLRRRRGRNIYQVKENGIDNRSSTGVMTCGRTESQAE